MWAIMCCVGEPHSMLHVFYWLCNTIYVQVVYISVNLSSYGIIILVLFNQLTSEISLLYDYIFDVQK